MEANKVVMATLVSHVLLVSCTATTVQSSSSQFSVVPDAVPR